MRKNAQSFCWLGLGIGVVATGVALAFVSHSEGAATKTLQTVDHVDLSRYLGTWYEIARYPNRFERNCVGDTTAHYSLRDDGRIEVVNSCRRPDGKRKAVRGLARVVDPVSNAKLRVTFFWPFAGDYWVVVLDPDYRYAVVGEPSFKYLWVLSRTPQLDSETYRRILDRIAHAGYDPSKLVLTAQTGAAPPLAQAIQQ